MIKVILLCGVVLVILKNFCENYIQFLVVTWTARDFIP
jgi:hypothetical protein